MNIETSMTRRSQHAYCAANKRRHGERMQITDDSTLSLLTMTMKAMTHLASTRALGLPLQKVLRHAGFSQRARPAACFGRRTGRRYYNSRAFSKHDVVDHHEAGL